MMGLVADPSWVHVTFLSDMPYAISHTGSHHHDHI